MRLMGFAAMIVAGLPVIADAGLEICNDTDARQTVAVGYQSGDDWISEGWWNLDAGTCGVVIGGDLENRYYYLLAQSKGWSFTDENIIFCTTPDAFTITGDADCEGRGYQTGRFARIDTGKTALHHAVRLAAFLRRDGPATGAAAAPAAEAGERYGDPYSSDTARFQDCVFETEAPFCTFHDNGTKFFVYDDGRTPAGVIRSMQGYLPGTPVELRGDLTGIYDRTADIVLRRILPRPYNRQDSVLERLQGQWYSVDDPASTFTVLGSERESAYDGAWSGLDYLGVGTSCDRFDSGEYLIARAEETGETICYGIESISDRDLSLMYLPVGNFLHYRKLD
jgi:uncharacterized membrane protein